MGRRYSYSQPSESEDYGGNSTDTIGYSSIEELIRRDQTELGHSEVAEPHQYPPQPEVEFGFPHVCYCGAQPILVTSRSEPGRRIYTCENIDDGECHVWKPWDVAVMEEMRARDRHTLEIAEKVDALTLLSDYETEQKVAKLELIVSELGNKNSRLNKRFDMVVGLLFVLVVVIGLVVMYK